MISFNFHLRLFSIIQYILLLFLFAEHFTESAATGAVNVGVVG
jgi:hypothetical protein